ncbi:helix-turn-helix transcriptional regulator [Geodermatophilus sp. SYSU D00700]
MSAAPPAAPSPSATGAVLQACGRVQPPLALLGDVARAVRRSVPHAAAGWLVTDPDTLLGTAILADGVDPVLQRRLIEHEWCSDDVNRFVALAHRRRPVSRLSAATHGDLGRSARYRALYAPQGFGDELRAVFRAGGQCWGAVCLTRGADAPPFAVADEVLLARVAGHVGAALRTSLAVRDADRPGEPPEAPGVVLLDRGDVHAVTGPAERWLAELPVEELPLPSVVYAVAARARRLAAGGDAGRPARAQVRGRSGRHLSVHAACLDPPDGGTERVAVVLEPARRSEVAPLICALAELTPREREVTQLLLRGEATADIAHALWISPHTLRGHVASVFAKLGVHSRPELCALLAEQHEARLLAGRDPAGDERRSRGEPGRLTVGRVGLDADR